jgi:hypothetical protein
VSTGKHEHFVRERYLNGGGKECRSHDHPAQPGASSLAPTREPQEPDHDSNQTDVTDCGTTSSGGSANARGVQDGVRGVKTIPMTADLAVVVESWSYLPETARQQVVSIVRSSILAPVGGAALAGSPGSSGDRGQRGMTGSTGTSGYTG